MTVARITGIYNETRTSKGGKEYQVRVVKGVKYGTEVDWEQPIFLNDKKILRKLEDYAKGDVANFKYEKKGNFFNLVDITDPDPEYLAKIDNGEVTEPRRQTGGSSYSGGSKKTSSGGLTKEEWAEKDRVKTLAIAKAVALKAAVDNTKIGTTAEALIEFAEQLIPWLLKTGGRKDERTDDGTDPLDPPVE